jgi:hypothetical protein
MKALFNKIVGLDVATGLCCVLSIGSIVLACLGATNAGAWMSTWPCLAGVALLVTGISVIGIRAIVRKHVHSALFHAGCAMIMIGWLIGQVAIRTETPAYPVNGMMAMIDGDVSNELSTGPRLETFVGRVPFSVRLDKFIIERYPSREPGAEGPVREYRSQVTLLEKDKPPRIENIRVNHPVRVQGFYIYQMSWGATQDRLGRPVNYTVLQFIRDPGLIVVYTGFGVLFVGALWFAARFFRLAKGAQ